MQKKEELQSVITRLVGLADSVQAGASASSIVTELRGMLEKLEALAIHDSLTGALNRAGLLQKLDAELLRANRTGHPFSFAIISVDNLDRVVEKHGAVVKDAVLKAVAQEALTMLRVLDSFGRIAPNEFAIILPTTWLDQSIKAITRLNARIDAVNWADIAPGLTVSFSTGLTTNAANDTSDAMLGRAQEALAKAIAKGPGQVAQVEQGLPDFDPDML